MIYKSIFGDILLLVNNKNELYYCSLCDKNNMNKISDNKKIEENYIKQLDEYFNLKRKTFDVLIDLSHFNKYQQLEKLNRVIVDEFIDKIYIGKINEETKTRDIEIKWNFE